VLIYGFQEYGDATVQSYLETAAPRPGPGQLIVELTAAGVNPADIKVRSGARRASVPVNFPMAMGREATGIVREVGSAPGFELGSRVFGQVAPGTGAFAEWVVLDAASSAVVPDDVEDAQAACIPVSIGTAYDVLDQLGLQPGAVLLVTGAGGGVGTAACQLARLRGVRVIGLASAGKAETVTALGAAHVASAPGWTDRVHELAPSGVSGVLDLVGGAVLADAITLLSDAPRVVSAAAPVAATEAGGSGVRRRRTSEVFGRLAELIARGDFNPVISARYRFDDAARAVAKVESGHAVGNVVVMR
jgi:NADPH:quinone reductase-like Zn-dependent oxidoreductase